MNEHFAAAIKAQEEKAFQDKVLKKFDELLTKIAELEAKLDAKAGKTKEAK
jgi:hypothetical protein